MLKEKIAKAYNKIATLYGGYHRAPFKFIFENTKNWRGRVLDIGCGNGNYARLFKNWFGLDIALKQAELANTRAQGRVIVGDCCNLPFKDKTFEHIICISVLNHLERRDRVKLLKEIKRVLKQNGEGILSFWALKKKAEIKFGKVKRPYLAIKRLPFEREISKKFTIIHKGFDGRNYYFKIKN